MYAWDYQDSCIDHIFYIGSAGCEKVTFSGAYTTISFLCKKVTKKQRN